jgi:hypothetical protein
MVEARAKCLPDPSSIPQADSWVSVSRVGFRLGRIMCHGFTGGIILFHGCGNFGGISCVVVSRVGFRLGRVMCHGFTGVIIIFHGCGNVGGISCVVVSRVGFRWGRFKCKCRGSIEQLMPALLTLALALAATSPRRSTRDEGVPSLLSCLSLFCASRTCTRIIFFF